MILKKPPASVLVIALLYLAVGAVGFIAHFHTLLAWQKDSVWVESTEFLAVVTGVFLLLGKSWARWLAVAWIAFHVVISALNSYGQAAVHAAFMALIVWALFQPEAARYFKPIEAQTE